MIAVEEIQPSSEHSLSTMSEKAPTQKSFKAGDTIMRQGEKGLSAYVIEEGQVEITIKNQDGVENRVGTRGPGAMIGEMAIIDDAPRTATVTALEDCKLLEITRDAFNRRLSSADPILRMATQVILTRYRDMLARADIRGEPPSWMPPVESLELDYAKQGDAIDRIKISSDFKDYLAQNGISLNYQPIFNLQTKRLAGFEALMRWQHKERGFIPPGVFIPIIEESGIITEASRWALKESLMALRRIEDVTGYDRKLFMSVNFSSTDFASSGFLDCIYETISLSDIDPHQLHVEITERLLMDQPDNAKDTLDLCRKVGISISIDDFGTGYSSLSYLHYFPINTLKIDRSFISRMLSDKGTMELVKSMISLARNMDMTVIAEGVEQKEEAAKLQELGCDMAQGYFFAKPMDENDVIAFVRAEEPLGF